MHRGEVRDVINDLNSVMKQICKSTVIVMGADDILKLANALIFDTGSPFNARATKSAEAKHKFGGKWYYGMHLGLLFISPRDDDAGGKDGMLPYKGLWCPLPPPEIDCLKDDKGFLEINSNYIQKVDANCNEHFNDFNAKALIVANSLSDTGNCVWVITDYGVNTYVSCVLAAWQRVVYQCYIGEEELTAELDTISLTSGDVRFMGLDRANLQCLLGYASVDTPAPKLLGSSTYVVSTYFLTNVLVTFQVPKATIDVIFSALARRSADIDYVRFNDYETANEHQHYYSEAVLQTLTDKKFSMLHPRHNKPLRIAAAPTIIRQFANEMRLYTCKLYDYSYYITICLIVKTT
jgi:hypothetical protein